MKTIDITPTWSEWGNIYRRFAESGETNVTRGLAKDVKNVFAMAQGFVAIESSLTDQQRTAFNDAYQLAMESQY
jgi:hypothetical protein